MSTMWEPEPEERPSSDQLVLGQEVVEACADALLTACAQMILLNSQDAESVTMEKAHGAALWALNIVIKRTVREGAKPT